MYHLLLIRKWKKFVLIARKRLYIYIEFSIAVDKHIIIISNKSYPLHVMIFKPFILINKK